MDFTRPERCQRQRTGREGPPFKVLRDLGQPLALILGGYRALIAAGQLTDVSYVTDRSDVSELVRKQASKAGVSERVHIGPFDKIVAATRARATRGSVDAGASSG